MYAAAPRTINVYSIGILFNVPRDPRITNVIVNDWRLHDIFMAARLSTASLAARRSSSFCFCPLGICWIVLNLIYHVDVSKYIRYSLLCLTCARIAFQWGQWLADLLSICTKPRPISSHSSSLLRAIGRANVHGQLRVLVTIKCIYATFRLVLTDKKPGDLVTRFVLLHDLNGKYMPIYNWFDFTISTNQDIVGYFCRARHFIST